MSDENTREIKDPRSFEERVFARFDAIDARFDGVDARFERVEGRLGAVEIRITNLENRQYDTKPIWEQALAAIAEMNVAMVEGFESVRNELRTEFHSGFDALRTDLRTEFHSGIDALRTDLRAEFHSGIDALRTELRAEFQSGFEAVRVEMQTGFDKIGKNMEHELRGVGRKLDALNHNILELQGDQRYVDRRLQELESQIKPG